jgi:uncharacterized membrane protein YheB (UPF0754 family)
MDLTRLALDLSPVAIATVHGYGAAWLAVKMLFRPLHPIYIFKKKVPFTPGLLPGERERFVEAFADVIAEKLLTAEIIEEELSELRLEGDLEALARRRYSERSQPETLIQIVSAQVIGVLQTLKASSDAKLQIAREIRAALDRRMGREYHPAVRYVARLFINEDLTLRIVGRAIDDITGELSDSLSIREALGQSVHHLPEAIFTGERPLQHRVVQDLVRQMSRRLDFKAIIKRRFETFSNEIFEQIIYETAGREIRGITGFGTLIGLLIGILQAALNLGRHWFF